MLKQIILYLIFFLSYTTTDTCKLLEVIIA